MRATAGIALALSLALLAASVAAAETERPRVGLVLSGGGARGAAHVGVIRVLEELEVPVDLVVGTSMGSIVGGMYAAGYGPDEMERILAEADWGALLSDAPPRDELWFRRRQDDRDFLVDLEVGWRDGGPALPPGLILGRNIEAFLEGLLLSVPDTASFDDLRLPFRCVATDLADASAVVFDRGKLARAIRASMSIPGVLAPVTHDGRVLVDGAVVDNVPVDVARAMGAEVLIVVDISTSPGDPSTIRSLLGVSNQVITLLMDRNRRSSMDSLTDEDIAIVPELGELGGLEFDRAGEAVELGAAAADALRERLAELSVDDATWERWIERQRMPETSPRKLRELEIDSSHTALARRVLRAFADLEPGDAVDAPTLARMRERLAGLELFERIEIDVRAVPGSDDEADVLLRPTEKDWGPHYLRFGLSASTDLRGEGDFELGLQHTWTPIDSWGGEWRNELQIGTRTRAFTELYQPLDPGLRWFVAPSIEYEQRDEPLVLEREKVAEIDVEGIGFALALGRNLGSWGEVRVGYGWLTGSAKPEIVLPGLLPERIDIETGEIEARLTVDTLDDLAFPRKGVLGDIDFKLRDDALASNDSGSVLSGSVAAPITLGELTLLPAVEGGTTFEGESPVGGEFELGGFQRLSGLEPRELSGNHYALAVLQAYYRLSRRTTRFGLSTYVGASAELGGTFVEREDFQLDALSPGASVFLGADSFIGPAYVAVGFGEEGAFAAYVFIGPTF